MKDVLQWIVTLLILLFFISPFFIFWKVKSKNRKIYVLLSALSSLTIYFWYFFYGYDFVLNLAKKINSDFYYFIYDAAFKPVPWYVYILMLTPFIFTKIIYQKFTKKRFFISFLFSCMVVVALVLIMAYYILPKAGSVLLNNI